MSQSIQTAQSVIMLIYDNKLKARTTDGHYGWISNDRLWKLCLQSTRDTLNMKPVKETVLFL